MLFVVHRRTQILKLGYALLLSLYDYACNSLFEPYLEISNIDYRLPKTNLSESFSNMSHLDKVSACMNSKVCQC